MKKLLTSTGGVVLCALICNVLWGSAYPGIKMGYELFNITELFSKILFAGIRFSAAGAVVLIMSGAAAKKFPKLRKQDFGAVALISLVYTVLQYIFFYVGLSNTSGSNGSIVNSTSTFMAAIIAHFAYKDDKLNLRKVIGLVTGFAGVLLVTVSNGAANVSFKGEGLVMLAALCFVVGAVLIKKYAAGIEPAVMTGYNMLIGGVILILTGIIGGGRLDTVSIKGIGVLAYLVMLSAVAYSLWSSLLKYNPIGRISVYNFIIPVSGTILSAIFLHENIFNWEYAVSLILVCAGIVMVNRKANGGKGNDEKGKSAKA